MSAVKHIRNLRAGGGDEVSREGGVNDPSSQITELDLPAPPSANALFKNVAGKGRIRTDLYSTWIAHAGWQLKAQHPATIHGPVLILIGVERTNSRADIDNRIKPTLDLLVTHKLIKDDSHVIGVAAAWSPARNGRMRVAIIPAADVGVRFHLANDGAHGGWFLEAPQLEEGVA
jgi:Holliday junction resolvase RusA-like endonuclease